MANSKPTSLVDGLLSLTAFETRSEAKALRDYYIKVGRVAGADFAKTLAQCAQSARCGSSACPICNRRRRRRWARQVPEAFLSLREHRGQGSAGSLCCFSVVAPRWRVEIDGIKEFKVTRPAGFLKKIFREAGLGSVPMFAGIDVSLNVIQSRHEEYLQPQAFCLVDLPISTDRKRLSSQLREAVGGDRDIKRPVRIEKLSDPISAVTYAYKSRFVRRVTGKNQRTSKQIPSDNELSQLLELIDRFGYRRRICLQRMKLKRGHIEVDPDP